MKLRCGDVGSRQKDDARVAAIGANGAIKVVDDIRWPLDDCGE